MKAINPFSREKNRRHFASGIFKFIFHSLLRIAVFCLNVTFDPWRYVKYPSITLWNVFIKVFHAKSFMKIISRMWQISRNAHNLTIIQWRKNERDGVSNHRCLYCLLNCCFRCRSKKTSKIRVTGLCVGNSPVTGEFPTLKASNAENISTWWRHHDMFGTTNRIHLGGYKIICKLLIVFKYALFRRAWFAFHNHYHPGRDLKGTRGHESYPFW